MKRLVSVELLILLEGWLVAWYLGIYLESSVKFKCSFAKNKAGFYKAFNSIFGKIGRNASEEVLFALIKSKCLPVLFYSTEACPITSADKHSLEFTMNKVLYKIFGAMSKDSYGGICKYFGIDKVEESISHRQEKFVKRYSGYSNSLCHSISARQWCVKLLILYYCLFILCVFLLNLRYFLCCHVMVNKVVYIHASDGIILGPSFLCSALVSDKVRFCRRYYSHIMII